MQSEKKKIDNLFEQGLLKYQETPPVYAWDRLETELRANRRRKGLIILRSAAAVILMLLTFSIGYFFPSKMDQKNTLSENSSPAIQTNNTPNQETNQPDNSSTITTLVASTEMNAFADNSDHSDEKSISDQIPAIIDISESGSGTHPVDFIERLLPIALEQIENLLKAPDYFYNPMHKYPVKSEYLAHYVANDIPYSDISESRNWEFGGEFTPVYSFKQSGGQANEKFSYIADNTSLDPVSEQPIITMSMGVNAAYELNDRFSIQSGVYYSQLGHSNQDVLLERLPDNGPLYAINTPAGDIDLEGIPVGLYHNRDDATVMEIELIREKVNFNLDGQADINVIQHFDYVEVPILMRYRLNNGKFKINLIGGVSTAVLVRNYSLMRYDNSEYLVNETKDINSMLYNGVAGLGMVYQISDKLTFNMEPTFRYAIRSISAQNDIIYRPYSMGWYTGIRYKF
ncbi:MAG: outer membrane beta-barrel protein [Bacteroidales bacterium]|nr:outer membrane beta-barrel protein [Bacteroidales bacterium]